jgi:hypothetical protein
LRGECRAFSGVTVVTNARVYYTPRAAAGASGARHSLRPLTAEGRDFVTTRADFRRGDAMPCFLNTSILRDARLRRAPQDEAGSRGSKERSRTTRLETLMVRSREHPSRPSGSEAVANGAYKKRRRRTMLCIAGRTMRPGCSVV